MFNKKCCLPLRQKNLCIIKTIMAFLNEAIVNTWVYILNNSTLLHLYFTCKFAVFSRHPKPEFNSTYPLAVIIPLLTDYQSKDVFREALEFTHSLVWSAPNRNNSSPLCCTHQFTGVQPHSKWCHHGARSCKSDWLCTLSYC